MGRTVDPPPGWPTLSLVPDDGAAAGSASRLGPAAFTVSQLLGLLDDAVRSAGLVELWVTGTVTGLRTGPKFTNLELVDYEADGSTVASVLTVGLFARHAREITATLAGGGTELADGLQVALWGRLDLNRRYGRLRLLAERVDPCTTLGAAVLARPCASDMGPARGSSGMTGRTGPTHRVLNWPHRWRADRPPGAHH